MLDHNECSFCGEWIAGVIGGGGLSQFEPSDFNRSTDLHNIEQCTGCNFLQRGSKEQQLAFKVNRHLTRIIYSLCKNIPLHGSLKTLFDAMQTAGIIDHWDYNTNLKEIRAFIRQELIREELEKNKSVLCQEL